MPAVLHNTTCYHCGDQCRTIIPYDDKSFCCQGCKQVYLLLNEHELCSYYAFETNPGIKAKGRFTGNQFAWLDHPEALKGLAQFANHRQVNINLALPQMHCSSCVYLLENLHRIEPGILASRVNFPNKEIYISFDPAKVSLRKVVELLAFTGYEPALSLQDVKQDNKAMPLARFKRKQLYRIGVAGFCFANIMMMSFPEYFSSGNMDQALKETFSWLNLLLSLPVLLFSSSSIFSASFKGLRQKQVNIDAPIALAILITFGRSYYEIISGNGAGYLDSGTGIVFFMLLGRWFQDKTYDSLAFDRDYRSYFPLGVTVILERTINGKTQRTEKNIPATQLNIGDRIIIRNEEMIPADSILVNGEANIDYSFVNGENTAEQKKAGELLYAGGKQVGKAIELEITEAVSHSYITSLWNNEVFKGPKRTAESFIHPWARYFTIALFSVALSAFIYWSVTDRSNAWPALTAVLIVACPCSLLLSATFTNGNMMRILGNNKCYLRNASVIESLASTTDIVFDKTGTLTQAGAALVKHHGVPLTAGEQQALWNLCIQSSNPVGKAIAAYLGAASNKKPAVTGFRETELGAEAIVDNAIVRIGTWQYINPGSLYKEPGKATELFVEINNISRGYFSISNQYRKGIHETARQLQGSGYTLHVLSGDNDSEKENLRSLIGRHANIRFRQLPIDKLEYIKELQSKNKKVLMIGDGLNDAGALMQADTGMAINDNNARFSPACDVILDAANTGILHRFLRYARSGKKIIRASFILSILYNVVGLSFAVSAQLSPLVAAILMPASSISIVLFVTLAGNWFARQTGLKNNILPAKHDPNHAAF